MSYWEDVNNKVKFIKPDGTYGKSPSTGTTLWGSGEKSIKAFVSAKSRTWGVFDC